MRTIKVLKINILSAAACLLFSLSANAQSPSIRTYPTGNFIFCGKQIPNNFSYIIERQDINGGWASIAKLQAPANFNECNARIQLLPKSVAAITQPNRAEMEFVWNRLQKQESSHIDSLYAYSTMPRHQYVAGVGWFDEVEKTGTYKYRVARLSKSGKLSEWQEIATVFQPKTIDLKATPISYQINMSNVIINFEYSDLSIAAGIKLLRTPYLRNDYKEVVGEMSFSKYKGKMVTSVVDNTITLGMTYSYVAIPFDGLGNMGVPSEPLQVYCISKDADLGLITYFDVKSIPDKKGNLLKWDFRASAFVNMVEVYRSNRYDGEYQKITSLKPTEKTYFDTYNIRPAESYFYYIKLSDGLGNNLPSARFPAVLEGRVPNSIPPQDVQLTRKGKVVTLTFRPVSADIRGYYIYRADGYQSPLEQLPRMLLSTDSLVSYNDTLPQSRTFGVYSYAVASINTSYNISPMSQRVNTSYSGGLLPVPDKVDGQLQNKAVWLAWNDATEENSAVTGYQIFRKAKLNDQEVEPERFVGNTDFKTTFFSDSIIVPGHDYVYRVRSMAVDTADVSSFSFPYSISVPADAIMAPSEVKAMAIDNKILLQWSLPLTGNIASVEIYRAVEGSKATHVKSLSADAVQFEDEQAVQGVMYYYFVSIKYKNGIESRDSDAVNARWK